MAVNSRRLNSRRTERMRVFSPLLRVVQAAAERRHQAVQPDGCGDGESLRYRTMENLLGDQPVPGLVPHDLEAQLHLVCDDGEPRSFTEAERHADGVP
jgi:hypothetical protein